MASNMIRAIPRDKLDSTAYDACVHAMSCARIYAYSWYLDAMCDQWYALVLDDYRAVMPLPLRRKFGLSYIYQPPMTQQLGVFARSDADTAAFFRMAISRHLHVDYTYHRPNVLPMATEKPNLVLDISKPYQLLQDGFSTNRQRDLKKAKRDQLKFQLMSNWSACTAFFENALSHPGSPTLKQLSALMHAEKSHGAIRVGLVTMEEETIFALLHGLDHDRLYYLFPVTVSDVAKSSGAATFAIAHLIQLYHGQLTYVDFEGSAVPGVRRFYASFGAENEPYYHIRRSFFQFMKHAR